jgi:hypothetical protein
MLFIGFIGLDVYVKSNHFPQGFFASKPVHNFEVAQPVQDFTYMNNTQFSLDLNRLQVGDTDALIALARNSTHIPDIFGYTLKEGLKAYPEQRFQF